MAYNRLMISPSVLSAITKGRTTTYEQNKKVYFGPIKGITFKPYILLINYMSETIKLLTVENN